MILTLCSPEENVHIEISADQFTRLRHPDVTVEEIEAIAAACGVSAVLLSTYVNDLKKATQEMLEIDGACDYTDHM